MRLLCSALLAGGLVLVGVDVYESHRDARAPEAEARPAVALMEDGTPLPPPPPPPPAR